jgi:hypothetical protein
MDPIDIRSLQGISRFTHRLSELLASEDGTLVLAYMQKLGLLAKAADPSTPVPPSKQTQDVARVGVWQVFDTEQGIQLKRSKAVESEWRRWADVDTIPPKGAKKRVVMLGESTARGYFYDPVVNPAILLERMLNAGSSGSEAGIEVVDLAEIGITLVETLRIVRALPLLQPDALVVFTGNNWPNAALTAADLEIMAQGLRESGYAGCQRNFWQHILLPRAAAMLDAVAVAASVLSIPVVLVIPEFNLRDWQAEPTVLAPVLQAGRNLPWMRARQGAEEALKQCDYATAAALAREMITLDEGTSAVSQQLLANSLLALGRPKEARAAFEAARDAVCGLMLKHTPRCSLPVQDLMRTKSTEHDFSIADLPRVFAGYLDGDIPGRRLFMDYCHLTLEGMRVAMSEVATQVAQRLGFTPMGVERLREIDTGVTPYDEALAHFMAALHNAHYGQPYDTLFYHCSTALRLSPSAGEALAAFLDFESRQAPHWMCQSYNRLCESPTVRRYLAATVPRMIDKLADFTLRDAVNAALEGAGCGCRHDTDRLLKHEHGRDEQIIDLLAYRYRATTFRQREGYSRVPEKAYYQATHVISRFYLVREHAYPVELKLTHRVPALKRQAKASLYVNGVCVEILELHPTWHNSPVVVPGLALREGVNVVEIEWPLVDLAWESELERGVRRMERGECPDVLPVFGEVQTFIARTLCP